MLGFRSEWHAEAASLVPNAEVVIDPVLVTEALRDRLQPDPAVLACGPEPMLEAVRAIAPEAQLAWEAPMACGYGACYGCAVEIEGEWKRLCVEGPVVRWPPMLLNASGCLDALTAPETARSLDAFVTKTVTPLPRGGNAPVRIAETDVGMLNSIGLANPGRERFLAETLPRLRELGVPLWISVGGFAAHEYAETCAQLEDVHDRVESFVPERRRSARIGGRDRRRLPRRDFASALRQALAGELGYRGARACRGRRRGRRALGREHDPGDEAGREPSPRARTGTGGLSGPALKPIALAAVHSCFKATRMPIVGMGGVASGRDALELFAAGASAVALGTVLFSDPSAPARIREELSAELATLGLASVEQARGISHEEALPKENTSI